MYLKKFLAQPNLVGTVMIALMVCGGFVYAFAFDGFNVETATGGEVEAWLAQAGGGNYSYTCDQDCSHILCPAKTQNTGDCTGCSKVAFCNGTCSKNHTCRNTGGCPHLYDGRSGGCSGYNTQRSCPTSCTQR